MTMPASTLIPAILSSIIGGIVDSAPSQDVVVMEGPRRTFPAESRTGTIAPLSFQEVLVDGEKVYLSVAAQVRSEDNRIVPPSSLDRPVRARYQLDATGAVHRVWILTPSEIASSGSN
jgi:hypothetical protein